jgi:hypothetical protein
MNEKKKTMNSNGAIGYSRQPCDGLGRQHAIDTPAVAEG